MKAMTLSEELAWRGFVNQTTFSKSEELDKETRSFYWGCDPSSNSLTIGNLAPAMMARIFIKHGYNPVLLVGGATGQVGDPKDDDERQLMSLDEIAANKQAIAKQYKQIFGGIDFKLVDNYDWFKNLGYLEFLRLVGKKMSMSQMLDREFVKARIGTNNSGLSYAEFSYALIQGYDYVQLFRDYNVTLQICGADQWGNSLTGVDLIRKLEGKEAHVWSCPLVINKTTGKKFGKSEDGAIWLDPGKTSAYQFYQFWLNVDDAGVADYLRIYTDIEPEELTVLMTKFKANPSQRAAQKYLAYEVTKLVHGDDKAHSARVVTQTLFGVATIDQLSTEDLDMLAAEIPTAAGGDVSKLLTESRLASSNTEARRLIEGGAISIDGKKVSADQSVTGPSLIKKGKNSFILVR